VNQQLELYFWREEIEGAREFVGLQKFHGISLEQAKEVHSTFGDYMADGVFEAMLEFGFQLSRDGLRVKKA
jgi:hypothetical protein